MKCLAGEGRTEIPVGGGVGTRSSPPVRVCPLRAGGASARGGGVGGDKTRFVQECCPVTQVGHQRLFPKHDLGMALGYKGHLGQPLFSERDHWRFHECVNLRAFWGPWVSCSGWRWWQGLLLWPGNLTSGCSWLAESQLVACSRTAWDLAQTWLRAAPTATPCRRSKCTAPFPPW